MILTSLSVSGFRHLAEQCLQFCPQLNIIAGPDGQGKTNLLEAIQDHLQPAHLCRMAGYSRVVKQKNSLLRESASVYTKFTAELLDAWDHQIAELGTKIIEARQFYVEKVREKIRDRSNAFTPEALDIKYLAANEISSTASLADIQSQLSTRLRKHRERKIRLRRRIVGPHRDEIAAGADGNSIQRYTSAGQQRSALFAFNLAQMNVYVDAYREDPLFLVDDVDSELDEQRMNELLHRLESKAQVLVTTTKPRLIRRSGIYPARTFQVSYGQIKEAEAWH